MTGEAKLLIVVGCATVAEERHEYLATSHPNNKHKQAKVNAASRCGAKTSSTAALKKMTGGTVWPIDSCKATKVCRFGAAVTARLPSPNGVKKDT
jgi:hypothetical protein